MKGKEVKKTLIDKGLSASDLARITGFSNGHIYGVINGRYKSKRARMAIAEALGKNFSELWGSGTES